MKKSEQVFAEFNVFPVNMPVMTGKLYREKFSSTMTEMAYSQIISRLHRSGQIERISKGIYCRPKRTRFGVVAPSDREILDFFTNKNFGFCVGYELYNSWNITTQVSKQLIVYSSIPDEKIRKIGNVTIYKYNIDYTPQVKAVISIMELLSQYNKIQDINHAAFANSLDLLVQSYDDDVFDSVQQTIHYQKCVIASLKEVLSYHHITNKLARYLSSLSNYSLLQLKEIYEAAQ